MQAGNRTQGEVNSETNSSDDIQGFLHDRQASLFDAHLDHVQALARTWRS